MRFSIPHRRRRVFSFFDFRSSFPVFPTSLKLRAKKISAHSCTAPLNVLRDSVPHRFHTSEKSGEIKKKISRNVGFLEKMHSIENSKVDSQIVQDGEIFDPSPS